MHLRIAWAAAWPYSIFRQGTRLLSPPSSKPHPFCSSCSPCELLLRLCWPLLSLLRLSPRGCVHQQGSGLAASLTSAAIISLPQSAKKLHFAFSQKKAFSEPTFQADLESIFFLSKLWKRMVSVDFHSFPDLIHSWPSSSGSGYRVQFFWSSQ